MAEINTIKYTLEEWKQQVKEILKSRLELGHDTFPAGWFLTFKPEITDDDRDANDLLEEYKKEIEDIGIREWIFQ